MDELATTISKLETEVNSTVVKKAENASFHISSINKNVFLFGAIFVALTVVLCVYTPPFLMTKPLSSKETPRPDYFGIAILSALATGCLYGGAWFKGFLLQ